MSEIAPLSPPQIKRAILAGGYFILLAVILGLTSSAWVDGTEQIPGELLILIYGGFVVQWILIVRNYRGEKEWRLLSILIASAFLGRFLIIILGTPISADIYRYIWEGRILRYGFNPYLIAPIDGSDPVLIALRDAVWAKVTFKEYPAILPPFIQFFFAIFAPSIFIWKLSLLGLEALATIFILKTLSIIERPPGRVLVYLFLPLPLIELSLSGHAEGVLVFVLTLFVYLATALSVEQALPYPRAIFLRLRLGLVAAIGILTKYSMLIAAGLFLLKQKDIFRRGFAYQFLGATAVFILLITIVTIGAPANLWYSIDNYIITWRFNDSLYHLFGSITGVDWLNPDSFGWLRYLLLGLWLASVGFLIWARVDWISGAAYATALFLLMSPVFQPWYALWFAPLLCFVRSPALCYLALAVPITYLIRISSPNIYEIPIAIKVIEFVPVFILLGVELVRFVRNPSSSNIRNH